MILPFDGKALTETGIKAMEAGIPVVNLDRVFASPQASRTWIGGDNYGMGAAAGRYVAAQMKAKNVSNPVIAEIQGIAILPLTQDRSQGFADSLKAAGFKVSNQVSAEFTVESGQQVTANLLQAAPSNRRALEPRRRPGCRRAGRDRRGRPRRVHHGRRRRLQERHGRRSRPTTP